MRRSTLIIVLLGVAIIVITGVVAASSRQEKQQEYIVRGIFDNASALAYKSDIRVSGANVGYLKKLEVAPGDRAAVIMAITDPAFQKFYKDATCEIRLQSLIGEKFVDCKTGTPSKGELPVYEGDETQHYLGIDNTDSPVDLDLNFNVLRYPARERMRLIFNEFGAALAGRGKDLGEIIQKSDPSLYEIDRFLALLAKDNKMLSQLAKDGDTSLIALARERKHIIGLLRNATEVQDAVNARQDELKATLNKMPAFFDELEPTARDLEEFAVQSQPISAALNESAVDMSTFFTNLAPLAYDSNRALKRFSDATEELRTQIPVLEPVATDLRQFASYKSTATNARKLFESFDDQGGWANLMTMTIGLVGSMNGYDSYGHFVRSGLFVLPCPTWQYARSSNCSADFGGDRTKKDAVAESASTSANGQTAALDYLMGAGN